MGVLITAQTTAAFSEPFYVEPGVKKGFISVGLAGSEEVTLQYKASSGAWVNTSSKMTYANPDIMVESTTLEPVYRWSKPPTSAAVFVDSI